MKQPSWQPLDPRAVTLRGIKLPPFLSNIKYWFDEVRGFVFDLKGILRDLKRFEVEKINTLIGLDFLIRLFCRTRGLSNSFFHWYLTRPYRRLRHFENLKGAVPSTPSDVSKIVKRIDADGYFLFSELASQETVAKLREFALSTKCYPRGIVDHPGSTVQEARNGKLSPVYDYQTQDLVRSEIVQSIISDPSIINVAQRYLRCQPILDLITLWWSFPAGGEPFIEGAQAYHFDMDRFRWLKIFIFLEDIDSENGPHCFIRGSHRPFSVPWNILKYYYERHSDETVAQYYPQKDFIEFKGPKGTILAENTMGLHKGKPLIKGERLVFEFEFCGALFGARMDPVELPLKKGSAFEVFVKDNPRLFSRFQLSTTE